METHVSLVQYCPYGLIFKVKVKQYNIFTSYMAKHPMYLE